MAFSQSVVIMLVVVMLAASLMTLHGDAGAPSSEVWFVGRNVADVRGEPADDAERVTQAHIGTEVVVIAGSGDWVKVRIPAQGDYLGWMRRADLVPASKAAAFASSKQLALVRVARATVLRDEGRSGREVAAVTMGARLAVIRRQGDLVQVALPAGESGYIAENAVVLCDRDNGPPRRGVGDIIKTAEQLLGTPYLWGGMSADGIDCSGFVYTVFYVNGVILPRDAHDQYAVGTPVDRAGLLPGDLVFYSTYAKGASHVGVYTGGQKVIQSGSATGGVAVIGLDDPHYGPKYIGARRVL
ncbi:MAG: C40 family peptidase [Firmicutes bacterium]|nr:C40 family peptidase [Bacillota bacterium]MDH7495024.1 C40 family peptidase [Bacillota bacterium]